MPDKSLLTEGQESCKWRLSWYPICPPTLTGELLKLKGFQQLANKLLSALQLLGMVAVLFRHLKWLLLTARVSPRLLVTSLPALPASHLQLDQALRGWARSVWRNLVGSPRDA